MEVGKNQRKTQPAVEIRNEVEHVVSEVDSGKLSTLLCARAEMYNSTIVRDPIGVPGEQDE